MEMSPAEIHQRFVERVRASYCADEAAASQARQLLPSITDVLASTERWWPRSQLAIPGKLTPER